MDLRRVESTRTVLAPAKLNIHLDVLGRRPDGFHELETLIVPIRWWDSLSMTPTPAAGKEPGKISLRLRSFLAARDPPCNELPPEGEENLVMRALRLLRERSGCTAGAHVELVKRIPMAAGLGGGSSDAAAALRLANRIWNLGWSREQLIEFGAEIGSDVPCFVYNGTAICRGRGERVEQLPGVPSFHVVIVKPPKGLSTADVFQAHDALAEATRPHRGKLEQLLAALRARRHADFRQFMGNRLEAAAATLLPWIDEVRTIFDKLGCLGHQLSGSGSAYFGICRHAREARRWAAFLKARQLGLVYATRSCQ
jgi:4-diphosphocytidyl-2-C-methyl-D-erythritol kinase